MSRVFSTLASGMILILALAFSAVAQNTTVPFASTRHDPTQPISITAESLTLDQETGAASYQGDVVVTQGDLRMAADAMLIEYTKGSGAVASKLSRVTADGNVTITNGAEAAEAANAIFSPDDNRIVLSGDVIMTQGNSAIAGQLMTIDLDTGKGVMSGRVTTILQPAASQ